MNKLLTAAEFQKECSRIWKECKAEADFWVQITIPDQSRRLYGVPEWDHAQDIYPMRGIGDPFFLGGVEDGYLFFRA
jgi:hypothetical protein